MDTLENKLQKRLHVSLYALTFLAVLLGLSVLLEGCSDEREATATYIHCEPGYKGPDEIWSSVDASKGLVTDWVAQTNDLVYESDCDANIQPRM